MGDRRPEISVAVRKNNQNQPLPQQAAAGCSKLFFSFDSTRSCEISVAIPIGLPSFLGIHAHHYGIITSWRQYPPGYAGLLRRRRTQIPTHNEIVAAGQITLYVPILSRDAALVIAKAAVGLEGFTCAPQQPLELEDRFTRRQQTQLPVAAVQHAYQHFTTEVALCNRSQIRNTRPETKDCPSDRLLRSSFRARPMDSRQQTIMLESNDSG